MSHFSRTLIIQSNDLGVDATLLLTFDSKSIKGIYKDCFPTAWRVINFGATGHYSINVTFQSQLAFIQPQVTNSVVVNANTWIDINPGQTTELTQSNNIYRFSAPVTGSNQGSFRVWNRTPLVQGIGLGCDDSKSGLPPATLLFFPKISSQYPCNAQFTPILSAYIETDYHESQILSRAIETPVIWQANLAALSDRALFTLSYDVSSGRCTLIPDQQGPHMTQQIAMPQHSEFSQAIEHLVNQTQLDEHAVDETQVAEHPVDETQVAERLVDGIVKDPDADETEIMQSASQTDQD